MMPALNWLDKGARQLDATVLGVTVSRPIAARSLVDGAESLRATREL